MKTVLQSGFCKDDVIYVVGAISSDPDYKAKFDEAVWKLRELGCERVINPCCVNDKLPYERYAPISIGFVQACDVVYVLPDWQDSTGAKAEVAYAQMAGKRIVFEVTEDAE